MAKKKRNRKGQQTRAQPTTALQAFLCDVSNYESLCTSKYTRLSHNPEIMAAVNKIADLISSMTIHLMENTGNGDKRIKNELSRKIDINPNKYMTRKAFISALVRCLLLEGDGNAVVLPLYQNGYLEDLQIIPAGDFSLVPDVQGYGYTVNINGVPVSPSDVLHFAINPDLTYPWKGTGYRIALKDIAHNLKQAQETKKGFMESKWKPSMIIKVDALTEEFASAEGRQKLLDQYIKSADAGQPWLVPAEQFDIQEVRPLSLNDIAIADSVKLDKRTVASILDVPSFVVGEGTFNEGEWNNFVNTRIKGLCSTITQVLTKGLLLNPAWYFQFSIRSLYTYDIEKLSRVGYDGYTRGIISGNEVRDWLGLSPKEGLDELIVLENYIPRGMIGEQNKLQGGE